MKKESETTSFLFPHFIAKYQPKYANAVGPIIKNSRSVFLYNVLIAKFIGVGPNNNRPKKNKLLSKKINGIATISLESFFRMVKQE